MVNGQVVVELPPSRPLQVGRGEVLQVGQGFAFATEVITTPADLYLAGAEGSDPRLVAPASSTWAWLLRGDAGPADGYLDSSR